MVATVKISEVFREIFTHTPYPYQGRVAHALLSGRNVLLQAPTGAGKTKAALFPFLYAKSHGISLADRLLYAVPMRTLVSALYEEAKGLLAKSAPDLRVTIQMGGQQDDPNLEGDVVFATIDQVLSAYVGSPVSLPGKNANVVGPATLGSLLVFDEFHLLDPGRALATVTDLAQRLRGISRVLVMSATVTPRAAQILCERLDADMVVIPEEELAQMPVQAHKTRRMHFVDHPLAPADILMSHGTARKTIAVVNTVGRAQSLYRDVVQAVGPTLRPHIRLLHSRFLPDDRRAIETWALERFKEGSDGEGILIATQVIEVGLNISARALHTELAPASAVFQRAGRCARFAREEGDVYVYALPTSDSGAPQVAPYEQDDRERILATGAKIQDRSGQAFSYRDELAVTEASYAARDAEVLGQVHPKSHADDVSRALAGVDDEAAWKLIRDADSVSVAVHGDPTVVDPRMRLESFSLARPTFWAFARKVLDSNQKIWVLEAEQTSAGPWVPVWRPAARDKDLRGALWACVTPASACYDSGTGLLLGRQGTWTSRASPMAAKTVSYRYVRESYSEHIARVRGQIVQQRTGYAVLTDRLGKHFGISADDMERLVAVAGELHDVGKLTSGWQDRAWKWQTDMHQTTREGWLAHTDLDLSDPKQRTANAQGVYRLPAHAAEGAFAAAPLIQRVVDGMLPDDQERATVVSQALFSAIARHHGAFTHRLEAFSLPSAERTEALAALRRAVGLVSDFEDRPDPPTREAFVSWLTEPSDRDGFLLYWYVSRRLRLADQQATAEVSQ